MHPHPALSDTSKPILKWVGGKSRLLPQLQPLLPSGKRLIEPFVGAGSVFLGTQYEQYVINDVNSDLAAFWVYLKERPREFGLRAAELFTVENHSQAAYLRVRDEFNSASDRFERAVRLPYLNRFGFNGLHRVNRSGVFNTPYGKPAKLPRFPWEELEAAASKLSRCLVLNGGFAGAMELAGAGDVVYCDPPYLASRRGVSFTAYSTSSFGRAQHLQLIACAVQATQRGARVLISNHDTPEVRDLFKGWELASMQVRRSVSGLASARGAALELVAML